MAKAKKAGKLSAGNVGLALGILFAIFHATWMLLIAATNGRIAGWLMNMHALSGAMTAVQFNFGTFAVGIVTAFVIGLISGALFAVIYNWVRSK